MLFWASSETYQLASQRTEEVRRALEPTINDQLSRSALNEIGVDFHYIPIVMPTEWHWKYKARSRVIKKDMVCFCAPQLDYDLFIDQTFETSLREYVRGIETAIPSLAKLGLSSDQIDLFTHIVHGSEQMVLEAHQSQ